MIKVVRLLVVICCSFNLQAQVKSKTISTRNEPTVSTPINNSIEATPESVLLVTNQIKMLSGQISILEGQLILLKNQSTKLSQSIDSLQKSETAFTDAGKAQLNNLDKQLIQIKNMIGNTENQISAAYAKKDYLEKLLAKLKQQLDDLQKQKEKKKPSRQP